MRLLGLDLGTKTMGIAITDSLQLTVRGLENFLYANEDITKPINKIKEYIATYKDIEKIILGYPLKMNGEKSQFTLYVENFKKELEKCIDTKVELYDERLSTKMSFDWMYENKIKNKKEQKDKISAIIILEQYLMYAKK